MIMKKSHPVIKSSQPLFCIVYGVGCSVICIQMIFYTGEATNFSCGMRYWFFNVIFTLEMLARCYVSKWSELATDILLFFDVLAIMPFWFGRSTREIPLARCRRYSSSTPASISRTHI